MTNCPLNKLLKLCLSLIIHDVRMVIAEVIDEPGVQINYLIVINEIGLYVPSTV